MMRRTRDEYQAIIADLVETLVAFADRHEVTTDEYLSALAYLTEVGRSDEMILLGDTMRLSVPIDDITHRSDDFGTGQHSVEGPFWLPESPVLEPPYRLARDDEPGDRLLVTGRVTDAATGQPLPGTLLDLWQASADGWYELQKPERGPNYLRGKVPAGTDGRYEFRTVVPASYEIPKDGQVGRLLAFLDRHAFRANHLHLKVEADGYAPLTTQIFFSDNTYLRDDVIAAVKDDLIVDLAQHSEQDLAGAAGLPAPYFTAHFDIALSPTRAPAAAP